VISAADVINNMHEANPVGGMHPKLSQESERIYNI
jgi:hypothetical protein